MRRLRHALRQATMALAVLAACGTLAGTLPQAGESARWASIVPITAPAARATPAYFARDLAALAARERAMPPGGAGLVPAALVPALTDAAGPVVRTFSGEQRFVPVTTGEGGVADQFGTALDFDGTTLLVGAMQDLVIRQESVFGARSGSVSIYRMVGGALQFDGKLEPPQGQEGALFGFSVAVRGDLAVVGAPRAIVEGQFDRGAVYVYERVGGQWLLRAQLQTPQFANREFFGWSVSLSGDRIAIGAPRHDEGVELDIGAAYLFQRNGNAWHWTQTLVPATLLDGDNYGSAVVLDGAMLLVGAAGRDGPGGMLDAGALFAYAESVGTFGTETLITQAQPVVGSRFGEALALGTTHAFVGAPGDTVAGAALQGAVYAYPRTGTALLSPTRLTSGNGAAGDAFGSDLSFDGTSLLVGTPSFQRIQGAAYVFRAVSGQFVQQAALTRPGNDRPAYLGVAVAIAGDRAFVGANIDDVDPNRAQGVVQHFVRNGTQWPFAQQLDTADGAAEELLGAAVALHGNTLVAGAFREDPAIDLEDAGTVSIYERAQGTWSRTAWFTSPDALAEDFFGYAVAVHGDWVAVGAPQVIVDGMFNRGAVYLYRRQNGAWTFVQKLIRENGLRDDGLGYALAFDDSGDLLLAGMPGDDTMELDAGGALLYRRVGDQWQLVQAIHPPRGIVGAFTGLRLAMTRDIVALGAPDDDQLGQNTGRVHVYAWQNGQYRFAQSLEDNARHDDCFFGNALAADGVRLVIGEPYRSGTGFLVQHGAAFVIDDARSSIFPLREVPLPITQDGGIFGLGVALHGDRLLVGAPGIDGPGGPAQGAVWLYGIDATSIVLRQELRAQDDLAWSYYGWPVAVTETALAVAAPGRGAINPREGAVYVYADDDVLLIDGFE